MDIFSVRFSVFLWPHFKASAMSQTFGPGSYPLTWLVSRVLGACRGIHESPSGREKDGGDGCREVVVFRGETVDGKHGAMLTLGKNGAQRDEVLGREPSKEKRVNTESQDVGTGGTGQQRNEEKEPSRPGAGCQSPPTLAAWIGSG